MKTELYWIPETSPGRLAIMPRPRGGDWLEDEIHAWRDAGVDVVVSLLESDEAAELELTEEETLASANRIEFVTFPIVDRGVPESAGTVAVLVSKLAESIKGGRNVAIHCRQGIGRAALVAVSTLIRLGIDVETAITTVGAARGRSVPETPEQREWLLAFARQAAKPLPA